MHKAPGTLDVACGLIEVKIRIMYCLCRTWRYNALAYGAMRLIVINLCKSTSNNALNYPIT